MTMWWVNNKQRKVYVTQRFKSPVKAKIPVLFKPERTTFKRFMEKLRVKTIKRNLAW